MAGFLAWLYNLSISETVRESLWLFPVLECIHIYSMVLLISIVSIFDLQLIGLRLTRRSIEPLSHLSRVVVRWSLYCLAINFATGFLLFSSKAPDYYTNSAFLIKMLLITLAVVYHAVVLRRAFHWNEDAVVPRYSKIGAFLSLAVWVGVIAASRWIAFVHS